SSRASINSAKPPGMGSLPSVGSGEGTGEMNWTMGKSMAMPLSSSGPENSKQPDQVVEGVVGDPCGQFRRFASPAFREAFDRLVLRRGLAPAEPVQGGLLLCFAMGLGCLLQQLGGPDTLEVEAPQLAGAERPRGHRPGDKVRFRGRQSASGGLLGPQRLGQLHSGLPLPDRPEAEHGVETRPFHVSPPTMPDRKSTRLNSSHVKISYA